MHIFDHIIRAGLVEFGFSHAELFLFGLKFSSLEPVGPKKCMIQARLTSREKEAVVLLGVVVLVAAFWMG